MRITSTETRAARRAPSPSLATSLGPAVIPAPPAELGRLPQWLLWRWETRAGKATKVPYGVRTGRRADVRDPAARDTCEAAQAALRAGGARYAGLGFVFTPDDPFCGVDLDGALDAGGRLLRWARAFVDRLSTYAEVSPSGRGVKLFLRGNLARAAEAARGGGRVRHRRCGLGPGAAGAVEFYDDRRFFTVTGRRLAGSPPAVAERQLELNLVYRELFPPPAPHPPRNRFAGWGTPSDDETILRRARAAANGAKFARLWAGDASAYGGDESARDAALCACLAFYTRDPEQVERLVTRSGCRREKWDERPDYRQRTIRFALSGAA